MTERLRVVIGGMQLRDGASTVAQTFGKVLARAGLWVVQMEPNFASTIYGAPQSFILAVTSEPSESWGDRAVDVLLELDFDRVHSTIDRHAADLLHGGVLIYDSSGGEISAEDASSFRSREILVVPIKARDIARDEFKLEIARNMIGLGALCGVLGFDHEGAIVGKLLQETFARKGESVVRKNKEVVERGRTLVKEALRGQCTMGADVRQTSRSIWAGRNAAEERLFISGNGVMAMGAVTAGCRGATGYPITPASALLEHMAEWLPSVCGVVIQGMSEKEAVRIAIGMSYAGIRVCIPTSGPGFTSGMIEEIGLAAMAEIPLVVVDNQRAGPSTGMPTKSEQSDLRIVVAGSHGDVSHIVLAARSIEHSYRLIQEAFCLADRYRCPIIVLADLNIAEGMATLPVSFLHDHRMNMGREQVHVPGFGGSMTKTTGTEHHPEIGFVTTDPALRKKMMDRRFQKMHDYLAKDAQPPHTPFGTEPIMVVTWGSPSAVVEEAISRLRNEGHKAGLAVFTNLWPLHPVHVAETLGVSQVIVCEQNAMGQFAQLLRGVESEKGGIRTQSILKYDGRPFWVDEVADAIRQLMDAPQMKEVRCGG